MRLVICSLILLLASCKHDAIKPKPVKDSIVAAAITDSIEYVIKADTVKVEKYEYQYEPFALIDQYPKIKDTTFFIKELRRNCNLDYNTIHKRETINYFNKTKIFGSDKNYFLIEYDRNDGFERSAKTQIIFNSSGKAISFLGEEKVVIAKIFPNQNPFLITLLTTGHCNGGHSIYKIKRDTVEQVLDDFIGNRPLTYDCNPDESINEPTEFNYNFKDVNKDGFNDIIFSGKILCLSKKTKDGFEYDVETINGKSTPFTRQHPAKIIKVRYIFLYNKQTGHFTEAEDYSKKYEFIYGNSK